MHIKEINQEDQKNKITAIIFANVIAIIYNIKMFTFTCMKLTDSMIISK